MKTTTPHQHRVQEIKGFFLILFALMVIIYAYGCSPQRNGCYGTRGMSGYSRVNYLKTESHLIKIVK
jgi:hypothetical protein